MFTHYIINLNHKTESIAKGFHLFPLNYTLEKINKNPDDTG